MNGQVLVGAAVGRITPELGRSMAGYASRQGPAASVLDDLHCRAVVLTDQRTTLVLVVLDLVSAPGALATAIARGVADDLGVDERAVLVSATHTHCGPSLDNGPGQEALFRSIVTASARCVREAYEERQECRLHRTSFPVDELVRNRRDPATPVDGRGTALVAVTAAGDVLATIVSMACHATVLEGDTCAYSADYPGALCASLESLCGGVAVFLQGFAGDVNPVFAEHTPAEVCRFGRLAGARAAAAVLATLRTDRDSWTINLSQDAALAVPLPQAGTRIDATPLAAAWADVEVEAKPRMGLAEAQHARAAAQERAERADTPEERRAATAIAQEMWIEALFADLHLGLAVDVPPPGVSTLPVQVLAIGPNMWIVALPGEPLTEVGRPLRRELGDTVILVGYAHRSACYLPPLGEFPHHGYEVGATRYAPGTAERLTDAAIGLVRRLAEADLGSGGRSE